MRMILEAPRILGTTWCKVDDGVLGIVTLVYQSHPPTQSTHTVGKVNEGGSQLHT